MASRLALRSIARTSSIACRRALHSSSYARAVTEFKMPAMSPTMESGKISSWKLKEGESFSSGDVLLTVETDKAEVDVEAQDDGILGKIILDEKESNIVVGKTIALLAEEGDDISNLEVPADSSSAPKSESSSSAQPSEAKSSTSQSEEAQQKLDSQTPRPGSSTSSTPSTVLPFGEHHDLPKHARALLPSVARLLIEAGVSDASDIKGSGLRGQLTKGDVLKYLGKIDNAEGTSHKLKAFSDKMDKPKDANRPGSAAPEAAKPAEQKILSGPEFRRSIASGLAKKEQPYKTPISVYSFDDILEGYLPPAPAAAKPAPATATSSFKKDSFDEFLGL